LFTLWTALLLSPVGTVAQDWSSIATVQLTDVPEASHMAIELSGDLLFIAISNADGGTVRVHQRHQGGLDQWGVLGTVHRDDPWFGRSIALHEGRLAVGSPATDDAGPLTGEVRMYTVDLEPGADVLQPSGVIALEDRTSNDRFGYTVCWLGDTLAVSAVGRAARRSFGKVFLFSSGDVPALIAPLPSSSEDVQAPFIRWFGATMTTNGNRLAIAAPFTGFEATRPMQNIGSIHMYRRDALEPSGWTRDTAWADTRVDTAIVCSFQHMELGRWGLAFAGEELVMDHAQLYQGISGNDLEPWYFPDTSEACPACGLRIVRNLSGVWDLSGSSPVAPYSPQQTRAVHGWTVAEDALYVGWFDPTNEVWTTAVHRRDQGGPGAWGVEATIPSTDPCDDLSGPLDVNGALLARLTERRGAECGVAPGMVRIGVEIFGQ
jgi:hypothetical protein